MSTPMQIHLVAVNDSPNSRLLYSNVLTSASAVREHQHVLTDSPADADLNLLVGELPSMQEAKAAPLVQQYPDKTLLYTEIDASIPFLAGVYCSARKGRPFDEGRTRSFAYLSSYGTARNPQIALAQPSEKSLLCCFRGKRDCRVRARLMDHDFNRSDVLIVDTSDYTHWIDGHSNREDMQKDYVATMMRSHFALCPRGAGFGSIRLFEAMEMGIAPVLFSDFYQLPKGPRWGDFLLQIKEGEYARTAEILDRHVSESAERGRLAREAWQQYFAPEVAFNRLIEQVMEVREESRAGERTMRRLWPVLQARDQGRARAAALFHRTRKRLRTMVGLSAETKGAVPTDGI